MNAPDAKAGEHRIVQLNRPSRVLDRDERIQISDYVEVVLAGERVASVQTRWAFWLIRSSMSGGDFSGLRSWRTSAPRGSRREVRRATG